MERRKRASRKKGRPVRKSRLKRGPRNPMSRTVTARMDTYGHKYGGSITTFAANDEPSFSPTPKGPVNGAAYSTCQIIQNFGGVTGGINNGSAQFGPTIAAQANANTYIGMGFELTDLDQAVGLTGLFDQYRFDRIEMKVTPATQATNITSASPNAVIPVLTLALDFDNNAAPTSWSQVRQIDNAQSLAYGAGGFFIEIEPAYTPPVFAGGAFSAYTVEKASWIDSANTGAIHYGLKGVCSSLTAASTLNVYWNVQVKYFTSFRNTI